MSKDDYYREFNKIKKRKTIKNKSKVKEKEHDKLHTKALYDIYTYIYI